VRPVRIAPSDTVVRHGPDGSIYMESPFPLGPYASKLTERLELWAAESPDRTFLAERDAAGGWRRVSYREALAIVRSLAQAMLSRGLSAARPLLILSGNGIDHALLALGAMYAGVPYAPIAPAYSLQAREFTTLQQIFERMQPGLVFAAEGAAYERALAATLPPGVELVVSSSAPPSIPATTFVELVATPATAAVDEAHARVDGDTVAKILFTSGSTGRPKGVINTQRMLCSNQEMLRSVFLFLQDAPPVLCDWLPWNHTAGGNHNFGIVLYNGGTLYIDEGKPTAAHFGATVRNLREVPCTAHFTVPRFYEMLMPHLRSDRVLRDTFFKDLKLIFYAAAGLGQRFWDELRDVSIEACGEELLIMTGLGATETAPFAICTGLDGASAGMIGLPCPGMALKLTPVGGKLEGRVRGPNITPGYYKDEALTANSIRDGWLHTGDLGYLSDGELFVCGRVKDVIIVNGRKHHAQDLEWSLDDLAGIRRGRVVAFGTAERGRPERAVIVVEPSGTVPADVLTDAIRRRIVDLCGLLIHDVVLVRRGMVARTTSGKLRRAATKQRYEQGDLEVAGGQTGLHA